jgi:hypothetical protein
MKEENSGSEDDPPNLKRYDMFVSWEEDFEPKIYEFKAIY